MQPSNKSPSYSLFKYGLPFVSFIVLGSFLLREFTSIRYEVYNYKRRYVGIKRREYCDDDGDNGLSETKQESQQKSTGADSQEEIEPDLKELIVKGQQDDWKNIRGPRPWEDNREYKELIAKLKSKNDKS